MKKEKEMREITIWEYVERFRPDKVLWFILSLALCIACGLLLTGSAFKEKVFGLGVGAAVGIALWAMGEDQFGAITGDIADWVINGDRESMEHPKQWIHCQPGRVQTVQLESGKVIGMYRPPWRQMGVSFAWNSPPYDILPPKPPQPRRNHPYAGQWGHRN